MKLTSRGKAALLLSSFIPFIISKFSFFKALFPDTAIRYSVVAVLGIIIFLVLCKIFSKAVDNGTESLGCSKCSEGLMKAGRDSLINYIEGEAALILFAIFIVPVILLFFLDLLFVGLAALVVEFALAGLGAAAVCKISTFKKANFLFRAVLTVVIVIGLSYSAGKFVDYRKNKVSTERNHLP